MLSLVRLMLSRAYPARLSAERVVVRPLHPVFGRTKPLPKEQASRGQRVFSYGRLYFWFSVNSQEQTKTVTASPTKVGAAGTLLRLAVPRWSFRSARLK